MSFLSSFPFEKSKLNVYPHEALKQAIRGTSFILSYRETMDFFHALEPSEDGYLNLSNSLDYISTLDMVEPKNASKEIMITLSNQQKIGINASLFGGSPVMLEKWNEIMMKFDEKTDEEEEKRLTIIAMVQNIINKILISNDGGYLEVVNVSLK